MAKHFDNKYTKILHMFKRTKMLYITTISINTNYTIVKITPEKLIQDCLGSFFGWNLFSQAERGGFLIAV